MARRRKLDVDADGTIDTGVHTISPAAELLSERKADRWAQELFCQINTTAKQLMAGTRAGLLRYVRSHVEGPIADHEHVEAPGRTTMIVTNARGTRLRTTRPGTFYRSLDFGDGEAVYLLRPYLLLGSNESVVRARAVEAFAAFDEETRAAALQAIDALDALSDIEIVERITGHWPPSLPQLDDALRAMFRVGVACERLSIRPFEPLVQTEKRRRKGAREGGRKRARQRAESWNNYQPMVDRLMRDGLSYNDACEQVASSLGVDERTIRGHTTNPKPRNRGRWEKR